MKKIEIVEHSLYGRKRKKKRNILTSKNTLRQFRLSNKTVRKSFPLNNIKNNVFLKNPPDKDEEWKIINPSNCEG